MRGFVRARLDEDEQEARRIQEPRGHQVWLYDDLELDSYEDRDYSELMLRIGHTRVLAQVAAMRAIVDLHEQWPVLVETPPELTTSTDAAGSMSMRMSQRMAWVTTQEYRKRFGDEPPTAPMLRHLAAIWSEHDQYDPAWAPDA